MDEQRVDALLDVADDGIDFDGLRVEEDGDGYAFRTPDRERTGLSEDDLGAVARDSPYVANWHFWHAIAPQAADRWAFLRWVEDADGHPTGERLDRLVDGVTAEWGQLRVAVTLDDDRRRYGLRNVEDADLPADELEGYDDPQDARTLAKHDDRGRYRPLKTAPSLATGWQFPDLDADGLVEAVDFLYPATVANWHREREGRLDVTHWHGTVERQTGIYGVVETWDRQEGHDHVDRVAETFCADSQCLKRREWEYDADTDLDVDGGDGEFPCREPCSLVVAAARKFVRIEGEQPREYTLELTPSEKEQLEAIVGTVAEGRTEKIREADFDDPANRYRARYLRAKRFADGFADDQED